MVDLESDILVTKVVIKNRHDCCKDRLSYTTVSLLDSEDNVVGTYRIGNASQLGEIEIEVKDFSSDEHVFSVFTNGLDNSLCMDVKDGHPHNGTPVQLSNCNGSDAQKWFVDSLGRIRSKLNVNRCVEAGASDKLYAKLFVWDCHYEMHQQWIFQSDGRILNKKYVKYIGVASGCGGVSSGKILELHKYYQSGNCGRQQQWIQRELLQNSDIFDSVGIDVMTDRTPGSLTDVSNIIFRELLPSSHAVALHEHGLPGTADLMDNLLGLKSILMNGKISQDFCFGDCAANSPKNRKINGTLELSLSNEYNGVKATCNAGTITVGSTLYVLLKSINEDVADVAVGVSVIRCIHSQKETFYSNIMYHRPLTNLDHLATLE